MIFADIIYSYPGLHVSPRDEQTVYTFATKESAEEAYKKAKEKANRQ